MATTTTETVFYQSTQGMMLKKVFGLIGPILLDAPFMFKKDHYVVAGVTKEMAVEFINYPDKAGDLYRCPEPCNCGIPFSFLSSRLKDVQAGDVLILKLSSERKDSTKQRLHMLHFNVKMRQSSEIPLLQIPPVAITMEDRKFNCIVKMETTELERKLKYHSDQAATIAFSINCDDREDVWLNIDSGIKTENLVEYCYNWQSFANMGMTHTTQGKFPLKEILRAVKSCMGRQVVLGITDEQLLISYKVGRKCYINFLIKAVADESPDVENGENKPVDIQVEDNKAEEAPKKPVVKRKPRRPVERDTKRVKVEKKEDDGKKQTKMKSKIDNFMENLSDSDDDFIEKLMAKRREKKKKKKATSEEDNLETAASQRCTECGKLCIDGEKTVESPSVPHGMAHAECVGVL